MFSYLLYQEWIHEISKTVGLLLKIAEVKRDQSQSVCGLEEHPMDFQVVLYGRVLQLYKISQNLKHCIQKSFWKL